MKETETVARAAGIVIASSYIDGVFENLSKFNTETRSSLHYDLSHGKPMEVEALAGTVTRLGLRYGVPTPIQRTIYCSLLPYHLMHMKSRHPQIEKTLS
jgi:2-dehydropantoate 2-reductase